MSVEIEGSSNSLIDAFALVTFPLPNCQIGSLPSPGNPADQTSSPSFTATVESVMATYLYDVSKCFSAFYRDCPILSLADKEPALARARLYLAQCTLTVLKNAMVLSDILLAIVDPRIRYGKEGE